MTDKPKDGCAELSARVIQQLEVALMDAKKLSAADPFHSDISSDDYYRIGELLDELNGELQ